MHSPCSLTATPDAAIGQEAKTSGSGTPINLKDGQAALIIGGKASLTADKTQVVGYSNDGKTIFDINDAKTLAGGWKVKLAGPPPKVADGTIMAILERDKNTPLLVYMIKNAGITPEKLNSAMTVEIAGTGTETPRITALKFRDDKGVEIFKTAMEPYAVARFATMDEINQSKTAGTKDSGKTEGKDADKPVTGAPKPPTNLRLKSGADSK